MLEEYRSCLLGAAIGDALGMPVETGPSTLRNMKYGYRKAWRAHPNARLEAGQFTDDTQMMLLVAELFADETYSLERYSEELKKMYRAGRLRFPDGSVAAACEHLTTRGYEESGVTSTTSGCISLAIPFALVFDDVVELRERLVQACSVTHTHPAAHAAAITLAILIRATITGSHNALSIAQKNASLEDATLGAKIRKALELAQEGFSLEAALSVIGNDVSIYQTLPLAFHLISRYDSVETLLNVAANCGGNTDTIGFICGAYAGAAYGIAAFPPDLVLGIEGREKIESLAERLYVRYAEKINHF